MIAFLYYTEWYFIFPLYFKNYFQKKKWLLFLTGREGGFMVQ